MIALRRFVLAGHLRDLPAARRALPLIGRQLVAHLDGRERRLFARAVARLWSPWRGRRLGRRARKDLGAGLLQLALHRERELLDVWNAAQAREFAVSWRFFVMRRWFSRSRRRPMWRSVSTSCSSVSFTTQVRI